MAFTIRQKINTISKLFSEPKVLSALLSQRDFGYLNDIGWFKSFLAQKSIDVNENPIPWFTYPFIDFLSPRLNKNLILFEFGSGNSTLFFSDKVRKVISIEHNKEWYQIVNISKPSNVELILTKSEKVNDYQNYFSVLNNKVDIIIVDGLHRNECLIKACEKLSERGVIILDDSERVEYSRGMNFLFQKGFKRLDFFGISPGYLYKKSTTLFYKDNNCLNV